MAQTTLYQVAERAGVSLATASRVLNGSTRQVGSELQARVLAAARELRYTANGPAQAMARGHSNTVGLLVADIADPYFTQIAAGVVDAAEQHGLTVTMGTTDRDPVREIGHLAGFRSQRARGVIIVGSRLVGVDGAVAASADNGAGEAGEHTTLDEEIAAFADIDGRVVMISQPFADLPVVEVANQELAHELADSLVEQGHTTFAVLGGPEGLATARDRVAGFLAGLAERGIEVDPERVVAGPFNRDGGHLAMTELLERTTTPGCVFAVTDAMALGAMAAIREAGLVPGRDIAVAGFDNIPTLADVQPGLTTVDLPLREAGRLAIELLTDPDGEPVRRVSGQIVLRESTALP